MQLASARKARAAKYPSPKWGDHVLRGTHQRTRASIQDGSAKQREAARGKKP